MPNEFIIKNGFISKGGSIIEGTLTATTINATTYQNIPDNVTGNYLSLSGGTVSGNTVFTQNISVTGGTGINWFSGNTSTDLLRITQTGSGNALVVEDSANPDSSPFVVSANGNVGIGASPLYKLHVQSTTGILGVTEQNGAVLVLSGNSNVPRLGVLIPPSGSRGFASGSFGVRTWDDLTNGSFGNVGDFWIRGDADSYGINVISAPGTGDTEDYIRFYAGQTAGSFVTPDIHIQGTGSTRGFVGVNTSNPTQQLHVNGNTFISGGLTATTISATSLNLSGSQIETSWTSYVPVWTASVTNPVIGNGTIEGYYKVVGKTCFVRGNVVMGTTTTFGSGEWYISMPFTAVNADAILMTANLLDNGTAWYNATLNGARAGFNTKAPIQYQSTGGTANDVNATQPFTWTNTDRFIWNGSYEIA